MTQNLIDGSVFEELAESVGEDFAADLVSTFLSDAQTMFESLNQAVADQAEDALLGDFNVLEACVLLGRHANERWPVASECCQTVYDFDCDRLCDDLPSGYQLLAND